MKGKMSMEWSEVYTTETCKECNGTGMSSNAVQDRYHEVYVPACEKCEGAGKEIDPKLYDRYMDEYNYRAGLD